MDMWITLTRFPHTHRDYDGYDAEQLWREPRRWGSWMNVRKIIDTTIMAIGLAGEGSIASSGGCGAQEKTPVSC